MIKQYLLSPGPTPIPNEVALAMSETMIHHRTPQFNKVFEEARQGLKTLFGTNGDVLMLASSGTGAMEAAVTNLFSPGDEVLVVNGGKFGERWLKIANAYGLDPTRSASSGDGRSRSRTSRSSSRPHPDIRGVLMQASETSTTVLHPVAEIAELTRDAGRCWSSTASPPSACCPSRWTTGASTCWSPARRRRSCCRRGSASSRSASAPGKGPRRPSCRASTSTSTASARIRQRAPALDAGDLADLRPPRSACMMAAGRVRPRLRPARAPGAGHARGGTALGLKLVAPDTPSPAATGIYPCRTVWTRQSFRLPARQDGRHLRRRPGPAEGQDDPHRAPRLHRRLRRRHRARRARDGAAPLRRRDSIRPRRRRRRRSADGGSE